jgi:hypothetical protein
MIAKLARAHAARAGELRNRDTRPNLALSKRAEPDRGDRCERRLEYHVEYLMVFCASNAAATAAIRHFIPRPVAFGTQEETYV